MKQIKTAEPRSKTPSIASQLKEMKVGSKAEIKVTGRVYNNYLSSRSRLQRNGIGHWEHEFLDHGERIIVTRTA